VLELDASAVAFEEMRAHRDFVPSQKLGGRRRTVQLEAGDRLEPEQITVEAERSIEIRNTNRDVGQILDRH